MTDFPPLIELVWMRHQQRFYMVFEVVVPFIRWNHGIIIIENSVARNPIGVKVLECRPRIAQVVDLVPKVPNGTAESVSGVKVISIIFGQKGGYQSAFGGANHIYSFCRPVFITENINQIENIVVKNLLKSTIFQ